MTNSCYVDGYTGGYGPTTEAPPSPVPVGARNTPLMIVEMDFGDGWEDVSTQVYIRRPMGFQRGRSRELERPSTGTGTLVLNNLTGRWDRDLHEEVKPGVPVRFIALVDSGMDPWAMGHSALGTADAFGAGFEKITLFTGKTEGGPRSFGRSWDDQWTWNLVDGFKRLSRQQMGFPDPAVWATGDIVNMILDRLSPKWPTDARVVDRGTRAVTGTGAEGQQSALELLLLVTDSERGRFFLDGEGNAIFQDANYIQSHPVDPIPFGDEVSDRPYLDIEEEDDDRELFNEVTVTSTLTGAPPQTASDAGSQIDHGISSTTIATALAYQNQMFEIAFDLAGRYGQPRPRITALVLGTEGADWRTLLKKGIGDRVYVKRRTTYGTVKTQLSTIEGITLDTPGTENWRLRWALSQVVDAKPNMFTEAESSFDYSSGGAASVAASGWTPGNALTTLDISVPPPPQFPQPPHLLGFTSLRLLAPSNIAGSTTRATSPTKFVTPGLTYTGQGWFSGPVNNSYSWVMELEWRAADASVISTTTVTKIYTDFPSITTAGWRMIELVGVAPVGAVFVAVSYTHLTLPTN